MKYAAHDDVSIYGIGWTAEDAIKDADHWAGPGGQYKIAPISDDLFNSIWVDGWNGARNTFVIDRSTGYIIDTTDND